MLRRLCNVSAIWLTMLSLISATMTDEATPGIDWDKLSHDFGTVVQGEIVETVFTVTNNRKDTLIVENAMGSCGCLASKWPHEPVLPGRKAEITVKFDSKGKTGNQMKSVAVYTNKGLFSLGLNAHVIKKE